MTNLKRFNLGIYFVTGLFLFVGPGISIASEPLPPGFTRTGCDPDPQFTSWIGGFKILDYASPPESTETDPPARIPVTITGLDGTRVDLGNPYGYAWNPPPGPEGSFSYCEDYTLSVPVPTGFTVSHVLCYGYESDFPECTLERPRTPGNSVVINVPEPPDPAAIEDTIHPWRGGGAWFFFTPIVSPPPPPAGSSDLIVQNRWFDPSPARVGDSVSFHGIVKNALGSSAGASNARLRIDVGNNGIWDLEAPQKPVPGLALNETAQVNWDGYWVAALGTHKYEICADKNNQVSESNEANNCTTDTFTVGPPLPSPGRVWGRVWVDTNANQILDAGEKYVRDASLTCDNANTTALSVTLNATGPQSFSARPDQCAGGNTPYFDSGLNLPPGNYVLNVGLPAGWELTTNQSNKTVSVASGASAPLEWIGVRQPPPATPDFIVRNLRHEPASVTVGASLNLSANIRNRGTGAASVITRTRFCIDRNSSGSSPFTCDVGAGFDTAALAPGASEREEWIGGWVAVLGNHRYRVCADNTAIVSETDETNNCAMADFTVTEQPELCDTSFRANQFHACYYPSSGASPVIPNESTTAPLWQEIDPATASPDELDSPVGRVGVNDPTDPENNRAPAIDNDWGMDEISGTERTDGVIGIWRGKVNFLPGTYIFHVASDDGFRLNVQGQGDVLNQWRDQTTADTTSAPVDLTGSTDIALFWYENGGHAKARLWWDYTPVATTFELPTVELLSPIENEEVGAELENGLMLVTLDWRFEDPEDEDAVQRQYKIQLVDVTNGTCLASDGDPKFTLSAPPCFDAVNDFRSQSYAGNSLDKNNDKYVVSGLTSRIVKLAPNRTYAWRVRAETDSTILGVDEFGNTFARRSDLSVTGSAFFETVFGSGELPECSDGLDNDGDGHIDFPADSDCQDPDDDNEWGGDGDDPECSDGVDNDGDGRVDFPNDPNCVDEDDDSESEDCSDGADNDGDGFTDADDPNCDDGGDAPECSDGFDNDDDLLIDEEDPECYSGPGGSYDPNDDDEDDDGTDDPECDDGFDNDDDGHIDRTDPGCLSGPGGTYDPADDDESDESGGDTPECSDDIDNDGDDLTDFGEDPGCASPADDDEDDSIPDTQCSDGIDNDDDDLVDFGEDPQCEDDEDDDEGGGGGGDGDCSDGIDNDGDGDIDFGDDPDCDDPDDDETPECSDNEDNDGDGRTDEDDPACHDDGDPDDGDDSYDPGDDDEGELGDCEDGIDNDGDGYIDYGDDPDCDFLDDSEFPECSDNIDNDDDGNADYPADLQCSDEDDDNEDELNDCEDGIDNDGDGFIDDGLGGDGDCDDEDDDEFPECADNEDNDNDGNADYPADLQCLDEDDDNEGEGEIPTFKISHKPTDELGFPDQCHANHGGTSGYPHCVRPHFIRDIYISSSFNHTTIKITPAGGFDSPVTLKVLGFRPDNDTTKTDRITHLNTTVPNFDCPDLRDADGNLIVTPPCADGIGEGPMQDVVDDIFVNKLWYVFDDIRLREYTINPVADPDYSVRFRARERGLAHGRYIIYLEATSGGITKTNEVLLVFGETTPGFRER